MNLLIKRNFKVKKRTNTIGYANVCRHLRIFKKLFKFAAISVNIYMYSYLIIFVNVSISSQKILPGSLMLSQCTAVNATSNCSSKRPFTAELGSKQELFYTGFETIISKQNRKFHSGCSKNYLSIGRGVGVRAVFDKKIPNHYCLNLGHPRWSTLVFFVG